MYIKTENEILYTFERRNYSRYECVNIDIPAHITQIKLNDSDCNVYNLKNCTKQFPNVTELIIGPSVTNVELLNQTFPNIKSVVSHNQYFYNGDCLIRKYAGSNTLLNTFCKKEGELIDLNRVTNISDNAFAGCRSMNIINCDNVQQCEINAFNGWIGKLNGKFNNGLLMADSIVVDFDEDADDIYLPEDTTYIVPAKEKQTVKRLHIHNDKFFFRQRRLQLFDKRREYKTIVFEDEDMAVIPSTITSNDVFVESYEICSENKYLVSINGIAYNKDKDVLLKCPNRKTGNIIIPEGVICIEGEAFANCQKITSVKLPNTLRNIGDTAFRLCDSLEHVDFGTGLKRIGGYFSSGIFSYCRSLKSIDIPSNIIQICSNAFYKSGLSEVVFHEGLESIGDKAFEGCSDLKKIELPASLCDNIGVGAFSNVTQVIFHKRLPYRFLLSMIKGNTIQKNKKSHRMISISLDGKTIVIPEYIKSEGIDKIEHYLHTYGIDDKIIKDVYLYTNYADEKQDVAVESYILTGDKELEAYIKRNGKQIAMRKITEHNEDELIKFLKCGLLTKNSLNAILEEAMKADMTTAVAYILQLTKPQKNSFNL